MASFGQQLLSLIKRNILLKKRSRNQVIQELFWPVYFIAILAMIKALSKPAVQPAISGFPVNSINDTRFQISSNKTLLVTPQSNEVQTLMDDISSMLGLSYILYPDKVAMEEVYKMNTSDIAAGLIFQFKSDSLMNYAIRLPDGVVSDTDLFTQGLTTGNCRKDPNGTSSNNCPANKYLTSGYIWLQNAVETALIKYNLSSSTLEMADLGVQMMPKPEYTPDVTVLQTISSIYFVFAYSFFINFLTTNIVAEKEKKIREGMKMMGLQDLAFWMSWAAVYAVIIFLVTAILVIIAYASKFFENSNMFIFFLMLYLYGLSIITFSFMLSPFFNKAKTAGTIASFSSVFISALYFAVSLTRTVTPDGYSYSVGPEGRYLLCLLSPVALALALDQGIFLDIAKNGMSFDTISLGDFPLYGPLIMLAVDIVLYGLLAFYFDKVMPGEHGTQYSPIYCFNPSYWLNRNKRNTELTSLIDNQHVQQVDNTSARENVEMVTTDVHNKTALRLLNITKTFKNADKEMVNAVDNLTLDIYEGQITGLLGHNGAGKTTLINMLCGLVPPTSGTAVIHGLDVSNVRDMEKIRSSAGICPQHNILYDDLSCREHLEVFGGIKGVDPKMLKQEIENSLKDVDLEDQGDVFAKDLSGGQKRKLSVAMALIGDPKVIILDEPTAGMDPYSRRHLWSLLKKRKEGKLILLTTHFMDEADILADRKAIISKGQLRCCGSSLYLKSKFGIGYHLNMVVEPGSDTNAIADVLKQKVEGIEVQRSHAKELSFTIPLSEVDKFAGMFSTLEEKNGSNETRADKLGIKSYGVSMTSLEEVFLKLGSIEESDAKDIKKENGVSDLAQVALNMNRETTTIKENVSQSRSTLNLRTGNELLKQRMKAIWKLKFLLMIRSPLAMLFQLIIPIILVVVAVVLYKINDKPASADIQPIPITPVYAKNRFLPSPVPNLLVIDSQNDTATQSIVTKLNTGFYIDEYSNSSMDLMTVAPHNIGIDIVSYTPGTIINYTALYNDTALRSLPVIVNMMSNVILGSSGITGYNLPWPSLSSKPKYNNNAFSTFLILGLAFVISLTGYAAGLVYNRQFKQRSQLRVSGITFNIYYGANYSYDICQYLIPAVICLILILAVQLPSFQPGGAIFCLILQFITFVPANLLLTYCFSFAFSKFETSTALLPNIFTFASIIPYLAVSLVDMILQDNTGIILHYVFSFIDPPYVIFGGPYFIDRLYRIAAFTQSVNQIEFGDYFKPENHVLFSIFIPLVHMVIFYYLLKVLDVKSNDGDIKEVFRCDSDKSSNKIIPKDNPDIVEDEDDDVQRERQKVEQLMNNTDSNAVAYVYNLRREFKKPGKSEYKGCKKVKSEDEVKVAVRNATLSVHAGEVVGLLGPNGAGKTTLMNMIIAEVGATRGKVVLNGYDICSNLSGAFQGMGYCPQHDALWEDITFKEHLELYSNIRGIPPSKIDSILNFYIESLKVEEHADKRAKKCSGGTKRKCSYAMSMLSNPEVVLLDEPSTGMDPESKRFLWDTISAGFEGTEKGAILTTHYMEEADALCNRLAIMVNGKIECLGPSQHLKDKFGSGYQLEVKLKLHGNIEERMDELETYLKNGFPNLICSERFVDRGQYKIPRDDVNSLADAFAFLEKSKQDLDIEEYSFSQSTLEQVFLMFAKKQKEEGVDESKTSNGVQRQTSLPV